MSAATGRFPWRALPALLYAAGIFYGGVIDIGPLPTVTFVATDKLLHALAFAGLAVLAFFGLGTGSLRRRQVLSVCLSTAAGGLLELIQTALPYRSGDWLDLLADAIGAVVGAASLGWVSRSFAGRGQRVSTGAM
ncbi:MAG TPA: VanZ family protein [Polyangiaceae bacterium]|nr:VanZ family protein [Polyangiaceae bacterium]